jgi:hypothetical protein
MSQLALNRRALLAGGCALAAAAPALAQSMDTRLRFFFQPAPGSTLRYEVTEAERLSGGTPASSYLRWRHRVTLTLGEPQDAFWPATLTISGVTVEEGHGSSLHLTLARIAEGRPIPVRLDRRFGFVDGVVDWPAVKDELKQALRTRVSAEDALMVPSVLDQLDAVQGSTAVGRPLHLISGGYAMPFRPDGAPVTIEDWQGGSSYILPSGRRLTSTLGLYDREKGLIGVDWSLATDAALAARHLGPTFRATIASGSGPDVARARRELDTALAGGLVELKEQGQVAYERQRRVITRYATSSRSKSVRTGPSAASSRSSFQHDHGNPEATEVPRARHPYRGARLSRAGRGSRSHGLSLEGAARARTPVDEAARLRLLDGTGRQHGAARQGRRLRDPRCPLRRRPGRHPPPVRPRARPAQGSCPVGQQPGSGNAPRSATPALTETGRERPCRQAAARLASMARARAAWR